MKRLGLVLIFIIVLVLMSCSSSNENVRRITVEEYKSKMTAGWIGQMVGVGWGAPTEFKFNNCIIPKEDVPEWTPTMINQHYQDDIYVEMTFLRTLEEYGFDVSIRQAGIDFANSQYRLWHANKAGRDNLRAGIAPPFSGHPKFNKHADDIDYQIEADYSGLIAPGLPQLDIDLGEIFGRLMNYGDGLYGGLFVAGMYSEAFFETDISKIIQAGLKCIPENSQYYETIIDVINWNKQNPDDWQKTWQLIQNKYQAKPEYRKFCCSGPTDDFNIDAKINGAYIVLGLLYGEGDPDKTVIISMRAGLDSDCNPSNAAGILFTSMGMENVPERFKSQIDNETKFSFTEYNVPGLIAVCEKLARIGVKRYGGRVENKNGVEEFIIPIVEPVIGELEQCWEASEISEDVHYTEEEMKKITIRSRKAEEFVSLWKMAGPFRKENVDGTGIFDIAFEPEIKINNVNWKTIPINTNSGRIELLKHFDESHCAVYLKTNIGSPEKQDCVLELGSDDGAKIWLNDELVFQKNIMRGHSAGEDKVKISLNKGWNSLMMKITQGTGGWEASVCISDNEGNVLSGLKYK